MTKEKFWLEDPKYLFSILKIIPKENMSLESQMNSLTRLVVCVFLILYLLGYKQSFLFLLLSLFFIIILYYLQKSRMTTYENFNDIKNSRNNYIEKTENLYNL